MQLIHVLFDAHVQYKIQKIINKKFVFVTNGKATSKFNVPVQTCTPAFPSFQRSQGAVTCYACRQHKKSAAQEVPQTKISTLLYQK